MVSLKRVTVPDCIVTHRQYLNLQPSNQQLMSANLQI